MDSDHIIAKYIDDLSQEVEKKTPREAQEEEKMTQKEANVQDGASYHGHSKTSKDDCGDANMTHIRQCVHASRICKTCIGITAASLMLT